jgi:hypothetical protein
MTMRTKQHKPKTPKQPKELTQALKDIEERFFEFMRRPVCTNDRFLFWSYSYSDTEFNDNMIKTMLQARIPQNLIYIYDKTGFMVNNQGYKRLSKEERKEIRNAALEYDALKEENSQEIYNLADYDDFESIENNPLVQVLYIFFY